MCVYFLNIFQHKIAMKTDLVFAIFFFHFYKVHALARSSLIRSTTQVYLNCYFVYESYWPQNYFAFTWNLVDFTWFLKKEKK